MVILEDIGSGSIVEFSCSIVYIEHQLKAVAAEIFDVKNGTNIYTMDYAENNLSFLVNLHFVESGPNR